MNKMETEFERPQMQNQMPDEIKSVLALCQQAAGILSDIIKSGSEGSPKEMVDLSFEIAREFDIRMQAVMNEAVASLPKIQKPPAGMLVK